MLIQGGLRHSHKLRTRPLSAHPVAGVKTGHRTASFSYPSRCLVVASSLSDAKAWVQRTFGKTSNTLRDLLQQVLDYSQMYILLLILSTLLEPFACMRTHNKIFLFWQVIEDSSRQSTYETVSHVRIAEDLLVLRDTKRHRHIYVINIGSNELNEQQHKVSAGKRMMHGACPFQDNSLGWLATRQLSATCQTTHSCPSCCTSHAQRGCGLSVRSPTS